MKRMLTFLCLAAAAAGCDRIENPVSSLTPKEAAKSSTVGYFTVQGVTLGPFGQIYQPGTSTPYDGGWINVYEERNGSRAFLGQVPANLERVHFDGLANDASVVLEAHGDAMQQCSFENYEGYPHGQSSITVAPSGDLPTAHFQC